MGEAASDFLNGIFCAESKYIRVKCNPNMYALKDGKRVSRGMIMTDCCRALFDADIVEESMGYYWEGIRPCVSIIKSMGRFDEDVVDIIKGSMRDFLNSGPSNYFSVRESGLCVPLYCSIVDSLKKEADRFDF